MIFPMKNVRIRVWAVAVLGVVMGAVALTGCATLRELSALRNVDFAYDRVSGVRLAGVVLHEGMSYSDLTPADLTRLLSAVTTNTVPLEMVVHVRATNPGENEITARLVDLDWRFFIEQKQILEGALAGTWLLPPGEPVDIPVGVRLDVIEQFQGGARDVFDVALEVAGLGTRKRELRLELEPTIQTGLGPMRYPTPIVVRRPRS